MYRTVNKYLLLSLLLIMASAADARQRMVEGVPWDAVNWEQLCKSVKPLRYTSSTGQVCQKVHPTDAVWAKWHDMTGRGKPEPKWNCKAKANLYNRSVRSIGSCKSNFGFALRDRAYQPDAYKEPLEVWRARYFGPWIDGD